MPQMPVYITMTSTAVSRVVNMDYNKTGPFNASISVDFGSTSMTATYGVQYTLDDANLLTLRGSTRAVTWFNDLGLPPGTAAAGVSNYNYPVAAVQFTLTAISSSYVTFTVLQS